MPLLRYVAFKFLASSRAMWVCEGECEDEGEGQGAGGMGSFCEWGSGKHRVSAVVCSRCLDFISTLELLSWHRYLS